MGGRVSFGDKAQRFEACKPKDASNIDAGSARTAAPLLIRFKPTNGGVL